VAEPVIVCGGAELLDELRPLWLALRDHHGEVAPHRGPVRDDEGSWGRRREHYERWLAEDDAFVLLVRDPGGGPALAYAFVRREHAPATTWPDRRVLDLETLSVAPAARGQGLGTALLAAAEDRTLVLTAVAQNAGALRFYEREGFIPSYVVLEDTRRTP
jgi:GNAT superfamily N-acetyltransferase